MVDFVIDGSNVLLGLRIAKAPSVRAFARMLEALEANGNTFQIWFDNSIRSHLSADADQLRQFESLCRSLKDANVLNFAPHADPCIQQACQESQCPVINYSDNNTSWIYHPPIYRCRFTKNKTCIYVSPAGARSVKARILEASIDEEFKLFDQEFSAIQAQPVMNEEPVVRLPRFSRHSRLQTQSGT